MNESLHRYFDVATVQWMSYPNAPVLDTLRKIANDEYFDAIELTHFDDPRERAEAKRIADVACLAVCYAAQPIQLRHGLNVNALDEDERRSVVARLKEAADEGEELGSDAMAILAGPWTPEHRDQHYEQLMKSSVELCRYLEPKGMSLRLEVFDYDVEKRVLIGPAPYAAQYAAEVRSQCGNFGLLVDLSHIPTTHETPADVIPLLAPYTTHVHIGNAVMVPGAPAYGDQHPRFGYPNSANGIKEVTDFLRLMKEHGLCRTDERIVMAFEIKPRDDEDADLVLAASKRMLDRAWAAVD